MKKGLAPGPVLTAGIIFQNLEHVGKKEKEDLPHTISAKFLKAEVVIGGENYTASLISHSLSETLNIHRSGGRVLQIQSHAVLTEGKPSGEDYKVYFGAKVLPEEKSPFLSTLINNVNERLGLEQKVRMPIHATHVMY